MTKLSHQILGTAGALSVLTATFNPFYAFLFYAGNAFPDVDVLWNDLSAYKSRWYSHRGFTHSMLVPLFLFLLSLLLLAGEKAGIVPAFSFFCFSKSMFFFASGYLFHLLCDSMSPSGIPKYFSYYPRFKLWTLYRTGSPAEYLIVLITCILIASATLLLFGSKLSELISAASRLTAL
jgi:membrane-bound metal-dependent hydrolase YbcI (DUF457 family)